MWWNQNQCNHNNHNKGNIIYHSAKIGAQKSGHKKSGHKKSGHKKSGHKKSGHKICLHHFSHFLIFFSSEEEGEEILRQRGEFPALPFTASDSGSPSPRSPRSPGSISNYSNGGSPLGVPWGDFSATSDFKYPPMPASHKYSSTNGRIKRNRNVPDGFVKSPASGKCLTLFF